MSLSRLQGAHRVGAARAERMAPVIQNADQARRADLIERALAGLRASLTNEWHDLPRLDKRESIEAALIGFEDKLAELLQPT